MVLINYEAVKINCRLAEQQSTKSARQNLYVLHLYSSEYEVDVQCLGRMPVEGNNAE